MKNVAAALLFVLIAPVASGLTKDELRTLAGSCTTRQVSACDTETFGTLETGDCLLSSGERMDRYTFSGRAGQVIEVMVRPLSASYTKPLIALLSPLADVAEPPIVYGGAGGATITYQLSSTGTWTILVSADDLFAGGDYVLHVYCSEDDTPALPQSCVFQDLLCGQTAEWQLNADSCRFSSANKAYAGWWIHAVAGDRLVFGIHRLRAALRPLSAGRAQMSEQMATIA
ncbi:MAG TPA: hypothetical protein VEK11_20330 [Thermoanaerobaculia bacterium]|nr:hypothetical protein [Thermoanaerobaculia bacterium]